MYSSTFSSEAHDGNPQPEGVPVPNLDPASIFGNDLVRSVVAKNLFELWIGPDEAVDLLRVRGHAHEAAVRAEFPEERMSRPWAEHAVLAHWIQGHERIGEYHDTQRGCYDCVRAMALRGDEDFSGNTDLLWMRIHYEVYLALTKLLRLDAFLTEARAVTAVWLSLVWPARSPVEGQFLSFVREAFAKQLGLPHSDEVEYFYQPFLRDLARPKGARSTRRPNAELSTRSFREEMERLFRPCIAGTWPSGSDARVRSLLLAREWTGQEAAEVRYLCRQPVGFTGMTESQLKADRALFAALSKNPEVRLRAILGVQTWLANAHPELADLVGPIRARD